ncbi:uncharacterized protein K444DRAFT_518904 [Hyaloscypha bicolor E]|uniref:Uncharacterized protein n=1 Tax=Hyaloscypha bicolor E TaxID=1095630 RepID=A0A2J6TRH9_9HELO|nr:uncharacterized protein K444DRAFT_518904 [Hyaloscypha bicolor E]PMD65630.1 hypothetical protein K444DRAFT_518904 [Hyaloscypha bicolor E]
MVCFFIDILIDILDYLYGSANLDINIGAELLEEIRIIIIAANALGNLFWYISGAIGILRTIYGAFGLSLRLYGP